jgi:alpha-1,2-glucosyltransferase
VQFTFLPILFPQFFLVYTDVPAMLFVLLMMLAAVKRRYHAAGALGFISCLMRQNDLIWMAFVLSWSYLRDNGWNWIPVRQFVARYWTFIATAMAMLVFIAANGGQIALGDAKAHPLGSLHLSNVFFLLFVAFFLFVPLWAGYRSELTDRLRSRWTWLGLVVLFPVFWLGFVNSHPYNQDGGDFYLRNALLIYFTSTAALKLLFFVPVALSALFFSAAPIKQPWIAFFAGSRTSRSLE